VAGSRGAHFQRPRGQRDLLPPAERGHVSPLARRDAGWLPFGIKAHRFITHFKRLREVRRSIDLLRRPARALGDKLVYVRLHGHTRKYASSYSSRSLQAWARRAVAWRAQGREVHIYFDNDAEGAAVGDARALRELLEGRKSALRRPRASLRRARQG
jgi:uncharacterized protein YecE (DUF72 family)